MAISKYKYNLPELTGLILLFVLLICISYSYVDQSISVIKYHFQWGISNLLKNYQLYHHSFKEFLYQTSAFHQGNSESGWRTIFYLLPLFIFCDFLGGLSLKTIHLFTITSSLVAILVFYWWIRRWWGKEVAFFASIFLGFSSIFQEIARSGSYESYSVLVTLIWISVFMRLIQSSRPLDYLMLGLLTGLTWYGYGILRSFALIPIVYILFFNSPIHKGKALGMFLLGFFTLVLPGAYIFSELHGHFAGYRGPWDQLFFDKEHIYKQGDIYKNINIFFQRMSGADQNLEPLVDKFHSHFYHPWLVVPFLIGVWSVIRSGKQGPNQLLIILALVIYLTPMATSSIGYVQVRRALLYVIPSYLLIGLGIKEIIRWTSKIPNRVLEVFIICAFFFYTYQIIDSERMIISNRIIVNKRDLGLLDFAQQIKRTGQKGHLYYLEKGKLRYSRWGYENLILNKGKGSVYFFTYESEIMSLALMEPGGGRWSVQSTDPSGRLPNTVNDFFVAASPLISHQQFVAWAKRNQLIWSLQFEVPVKNSKRKVKNLESFRFYHIYKQS